MNAWEVWECDLGRGAHPVVVVSHPSRAANKPLVEILDCSSQRASRAPLENEVLLDVEDGMDWPTLCKCDLIYAVPKAELNQRRGQVVVPRRRAIVRSILQSHGWNAI
ncbi:MAG: type II toxin-antitoxin system PemK/MazF family toxin [Verrucomicrobia bacterium]|nr:type II toxin-antitoxin system PemK/MazF family toxin [Verrucomicrobiota bacterium]